METPTGEKITASEFRIYKEPIFHGQSEISWQNSTYIVKLFQVRNISFLSNFSTFSLSVQTGTQKNRLHAVPFWIVKWSREIAEREKNWSERAEGALGLGGKKWERKARLSQSLLVYFSSLQSRCAVSAPSRLTRKGLLAV